MVLPKFNIGKSKIILNILLVNFFGLDGKNHLRGRNEKKVLNKILNLPKNIGKDQNLIFIIERLRRCQFDAVVLRTTSWAQN